jgi:hypothetical protein
MTNSLERASPSRASQAAESGVQRGQLARLVLGPWGCLRTHQTVRCTDVLTGIT